MDKSGEIAKLVNAANKIIVIQADNPDGDSLGSAIALEQILHELGKEPFLYCAVDMPDYLKHLGGWDRVSKDIPKVFDLSIIVDTSSSSLLEKLDTSAMHGWVASRPVIVLDHHADVECDIDYATLVLNEPNMSSTGELVFKLAKDLKWPFNIQACEALAVSVLADTMGLSNSSTTSTTYRVMADLVDAGVDRPKLEEARKLLSKMPETIFRFKGELIKRVEFFENNQIGMVAVNQAEINKYSPLYNPGPLMHNDILQVESVLVSIFFKVYNSGRITGAIRCAPNCGIADQLAKQFGGDGHKFSAGFKIEGVEINEVKKKTVDLAARLLKGNLK